MKGGVVVVLCPACVRASPGEEQSVPKIIG